jgi:riboflavin synthase
MRQTRFGVTTGLTPGLRLNLERALQVGARLSGHWVQGHVDETGTYLKREAQGISEILTFLVPKSGARFLVKKGSITLDGISLTIADLRDEPKGSEIDVQIIPHTWKETNLSSLKVGDPVNLEYDILAKLALRQTELGG